MTEIFVAQLVHTLNYGDAISGEALLIDRLLNEFRGEERSENKISAAIYSLHRHEKVEPYGRRWNEIERELKARRGAKRALVLHYSLGSPLNDLYASRSDCARILIYHNLTPERWYRSYNTRVAADLGRGRQELKSLVQLSDIVLADSSCNAAELAELGCTTGKVLPLALDPARWSEPQNPGIAHALRAHGGKNILAVGRLAPNKCLEDIIKPFYFYHHKINRKSRLWIVGSDIDTEIYSFELKRLVAEMRLEEAVVFVGGVADSELRAFYENSDLYMTMSEHEGFCVPLIEAMHFGVPVIAYDGGTESAVRETLGDAGVLIREKSPAKVAELMDLVLSDATLRNSLICRGSKREQQYSERHFQVELRKRVIDPLLTQELGVTSKVPGSAAPCSRLASI